MSLDLQSLRAGIAQHGRVAHVLVVATSGSVPREVGAAMLVWPDGQSGTIGGGALEFDAARDARACLQSGNGQVQRVALGPARGQCCGGAVTLVTEIFDAGALAEIDPHLPYLRRIEGTAPKPLELARDLRRARGEGKQVVLSLEGGWLLEPLTTPTRPIWIWGAGHVGRALVDVLAPLPGLDITWIDTAQDRFPDTVPADVTVLPAAHPVRLIPHAPKDAEHLILTYSHALDLDLCHGLLSHGFRRAGLIGSATKWARFRGRLAALGHTAEAIARIDCPIGNPALGKHPAAIAIGVAANLLADEKAALPHRKGLT